MSLPLRQIREEALRLPSVDRLNLAEELLSSVDGVDLGRDEAWLSELRRRRDEGHDDARPWAEVKAGILQRLGKA